MAEVLVHVVLVSFQEHVPQQLRAAKLAGYQALGDACGGHKAGILFWRADWNLDQRKNYHLMELGVFADANAFERFRLHPAHVEFGKDMSDLADWVVGDINAALPGFG
jgi:hypothetical protein